MKVRQAILIGVVPAGYFGAQTAAGGLTPPFLGFLALAALLALIGMHRNKLSESGTRKLLGLRNRIVQKAPEKEREPEAMGSVFGTPAYVVHKEDDFWIDLPDPEMII